MSWTDATILTEDGEVSLRTMPVADLVSVALTCPDYTGFLHLRGDQETYEAARSLCEAADPFRRELGADVLGQLGAIAFTAGNDIEAVLHEHRRFRAPAVTLLLGLAAIETVDTVQRAIATALGHLADPRAAGALGGWRTHPELDVRWSVSLALAGLAGVDDDALRYLVEMTTDPDPRVRDWSCWGLHHAERDTPEVRNALFLRIDDDDAVTRAEALRALVAFGDPRTVRPLLDALDNAPTAGEDETDEVTSLLDEALSLLAGHTADPRLTERLAESGGSE